MSRPCGIRSMPARESVCLSRSWCRAHRVDGLEPSLQTGHEHILAGRQGQECTQLVQYAPDDEVRRQYTVVTILSDAIVGLLQDLAEGLKALEVSLRGALAAHRVHIGEELRQLHGHSVELGKTVASPFEA